MEPAMAASRPVGAWRAVYQWPAFYGVLLTMGVVQLAWAFVAFVIRHCVTTERGHRIGRRFISLLFRTCFRVTDWCGVMRVDASALDAIDPDEAQIIAANHPSVMDALILISRLDNLNCIMKASVLDNLLLGSGARLAGYIRNDGPRRMLRLSAEHLRNGGQLIVFPEGTRTLAAPVNTFKGGFAAMARVGRAPIQTVLIETDSPYLSKGWPALKRPQRLPMHFRARLGRRFEVAPDDDVNAFVDDLHRYFAAELDGAELGELWTRGMERPLESFAPARVDAKPDARGEPSSALSMTSSRWG